MHLFFVEMKKSFVCDTFNMREIFHCLSFNFLMLKFDSNSRQQEFLRFEYQLHFAEYLNSQYQLISTI